MFELKTVLLQIKSGVSKKTSNSYQIAIVRAGGEMFEVLVGKNANLSEKDLDTEFVGVYGLNVYQLKPSVVLESIK